jgi:dTDP-4-dehydrorhamnose 3,5-epimerase-like enzyme
LAICAQQPFAIEPEHKRRLHCQSKHPLAKLSRVLTGEVIAVVADIRRRSPTFGWWISVTRKPPERMIRVPRGFDPWVRRGCPSG